MATKPKLRPELLEHAASASGALRRAAQLVGDLASSPDAYTLLSAFVTATDIDAAQREDAFASAFSLSCAGTEATEAQARKVKVLCSSDQQTIRFASQLHFDCGAVRVIRIGMAVRRGHWRITEFSEGHAA